MTAYDATFLRERGYFDRSEVDRIPLDDLALTVRSDPSERLAYVEGIGPERQQEVVTELRSRGRPFDFYWFWNPNDERVAVYRRYGEHKWFCYDQSGSDACGKKEHRLDSIDDGLECLFDAQEVVDQLYRNLWDIRLGLARSFAVPGDAEIPDSERLMAAQRLIDRLLFCYFLANESLIHGVDDAGTRFAMAPEQLFERMLDRGELSSFLSTELFSHLRAEGWTEYELSEGLSISWPCLNAELFGDHEIQTTAGGTIAQRELDCSAYDWSVLVEELNRYDWLIEQQPHMASGDGGVKTLSPAVLGQIFERFVVTVSELSDEDMLSLAEFESMDVSASGDLLLEGNREVGAYYTPEYIAYENTRETLWNTIRSDLVATHDLDASDLSSPDVFFERVHEDSFPVDRSDLAAILADVTVVDPAAGSGVFLLAAGDLLETWRAQCNPDRSRYEIRRDVVSRSLYGVDILDGAVDVCKLRLWLWLAGATSLDLSEPDPSVETLPALAFTVRQGNSLVGVAEQADNSDVERRELDWTDGDRKSYAEAIECYRETVRSYQAASGPEAADSWETATTQRALLQEASTEMYAQECAATVEHGVASSEACRRHLADARGPVKLNLDFESPMTDSERDQVAAFGFREQSNWETTAYHSDIRQATPEVVDSIFELIEGRGSVSVERPLAPGDVEDLDPFHWRFEFPLAFDPAGPEPTAFDAVIGNPPHGSSVSTLETALLEDQYSLTAGRREVAKLFVERSWSLTDGELSYVVPKASTYNSTWADFREYCLGNLVRGLDLGTAFGSVAHEQVTIHLSETRASGSYRCGQLSEGAYHLDDSAAIQRSLASQLGTIPVSFTADQQAVASGLAAAEFPTLGEENVDAGRGATTATRIADPAAPVGYNGKQIQRYFTRPGTDHVGVEGVSAATAERLASPKVMAQNIIAHVQRPYDHLVIAAVYDPVGCHNFETVTNVLLPAESRLSLPALAVLLNTQFVNWFVSVSIFNHAVRDMHLDRYFLERIVLPAEWSATDEWVLEQLYGLLSISRVALEYDSLPDDASVYRELQSISNALTYELYLSDVAADPLQTDLAERIGELLGERDVAYEQWLTAHLASEDSTAITSAFDEHQTLYDRAKRTADSVLRPDIVADLEEIATHPWVAVIERGQHRREGERPPLFGPTT